MKDKKNLITALVVVLVFGAIIGLSFAFQSDGTTKLNEGTSEEISAWVEETKSDKYVFTVVSQTGCGFCQKFRPTIAALKEEYPDLPIYMFDYDTLSAEDQKTFMQLYPIKVEGTPYSYLTKNGKMVADLPDGAVPKEDVIKFLKENKAIK